jgi:hypothetical protein
MTARKKWLRAGNTWLQALAAIATIIGMFAALYGLGLRRVRVPDALHAVGPYLATITVGAVLYFALRRHVDRRASELRIDIQKAQADAATALYVLRHPLGLRTLLERSDLPSGCVVDVEKNVADQQAFEAAKRLAIVRDEDAKDGHVYWVWSFEDETPPRAPPALLLASHVLRRPY